MGIFQRIGDVLKSNINDLIDKAEDPEKMVKQIIIDMQQELNKSTQALGKAASSERIAKKQYDDAARSASEWENRAKTALAAGDEELAKKALENKIKADKDAAAYKEMYDTISQQTETIRTQVEVLKSKLEEAKSRQAMLIARSQMAETQKNLAKSTGGFDSSSASEKFDRMEEKKKSSLVVFISILVALIGGVISVAYIVYKAMSNKSYEEKWKDYDECGI